MTTQMHKNYSSWENHWTHRSIGEFKTALTAGEAAGVHSLVMSDGETLDLLVAGKPGREAGAIPVFFNGAIPARENKVGPFFSGGRVGPAVAAGHVSIADPTVDRDSQLSLAWYAGYEGSSTQETIRAALEAISEVHERELVLVGGAGGGFAALHFASKVACRASVFVWNPQTDILAYNRAFVDMYLTRAFPGAFDKDTPPATWRELRQKECNVVGLQQTMTDRRIHEPRRAARVLILQNRTDWHLTAHSVPYLKAHSFAAIGTGSFILSPDHCLQVADWGQGHTPLPHDLVVDHLASFLNPARTAVDVGREVVLDGRCDCTSISQAPMDLRPLVARLKDTLLATRVQGTNRVDISTGAIPAGYGGLRFGLVQVAGQMRQQVAWFVQEPTVVFEPEKLWADGDLMVVARDGLNNHLLYLPVNGVSEGTASITR